MSRYSWYTKVPDKIIEDYFIFHMALDIAESSVFLHL